MLRKLMRKHINRFKEYKDLSCKPNVMTPQSWACPSWASDMGMVGSGSYERTPYGNMACHISLEN